MPSTPDPNVKAARLDVVATQTVDLFGADDPLVLASGEILPGITVAYETLGTLNADGSNAVYICHALTGDSHASGYHEGDRRPGWWDTMIGPGKAIDTNRWFVVCSNLLGGCQGTTGPSSVNPATGEQWGLDFPLLDMSDFVSVHRALSAHLGISRWHAVVGGSLGGMQALQWALTYPLEMVNAVIVAASSRLTAQNIAFSAVGRQAIMRDEHFHGGRFAQIDANPDVGLAIARMMAHITYLSEDAFAEKFGRQPQNEQSTRGFGVDFAVESYLDHQGEAFLARFDALSYLYLSRVMDYFDPFADPAATAAVQQHPVNFLVVSFNSDWRFSTRHSRRIVRRLNRAGLPVTFRDIHSQWGHDSFLMDIPGYLDTVEAFLQTNHDYLPALRPDLRRVAELIPPRSRVLDLGCGNGELLAHLIGDDGCFGTGVERDPESVLAAIKVGVPVVELDLDTDLSEFADDSYDVVVLSRTLQAVLHPDRVLREMARIAPRLIVTMPNFGFWRHRITLMSGRMPKSKDLPFSWYETPNLHHATLVELESLFAAVGLRIESRLPLDDLGGGYRLGQRGANLLASSAIYVLARPEGPRP